MSGSSLRWLIAPVLAAAALTVAACGSNNNSSTSSSAGTQTTAGVNGPGQPVDGQKKGGHLTLLAAGDVDSMDPGQAYYSFTYSILYNVVRPLYSYEPTSDGSKSTPDLADGEPQITDNADGKGQTITVKIKQGIKYSPPYGKEVKAADVKYAIERAFTSKVPNGYVNAYFAGIQGAKQYQQKKAAHISGITTPDDYTIVFKTDGKVWGDLAGALALPVTSPIPEAFAKKYDGAKGQSTYAQHVLATGPYMIKSYKPGKSIELARNPNWDAGTDYRPAYLDSVTFQEGNDDPAVATRRIINGTSLGSGDFAAPPDLLKQIVQGPKKDTLIIAPGAGMRYLGINTTIKPFDNINVRKAIAAVLNRDQMRQVRGGKLIGDIATHMLYPTVGAFDKAGGLDGFGFDFLSKPQGDLQLAMDYMKKAGYSSGKYTGKEPILMVGDNSGGGGKGAQVAEQSVSQLGFNVKLRQVDHSTMYTKYCQVPKAKVALCPNLGWIKDYADAGTIIAPLWNPANIVPSGNVNFSQYKGDNIQQQVEAAATMPSGDQRVQAWADLDKKITGLVLGVPYLWDKYPVVASPNVQQVNMLWNQGSIDFGFTSLK